MKKKLKTHGTTWYLYINTSLAALIGVSEIDNIIEFQVINKAAYITKYDDNTKNSTLTKKLFKRGAGYGLSLPIPILELLEINPEIDYVDINIENNRLVIKKATD